MTRSKLMGALVLAVLIVLDLGTKAWAFERLRGSLVVVVPGFWDFRYAENRDVGFSLLRSIPHDLRQPLIYGLVSIGLAAVFLYGWRRNGEWRAYFGAVLVAAGAFGNLVNRAYSGYVIDFISWYYRSFHWPVFNLADVYVVLGMALVIWHEWRAPQPASN